MTPSVLEEKRRWREKLRARLQQIPAASHAGLSRLAAERLRTQVAWQSAASILFYAPLAYEIDLRPMIALAREQGKVTALPKFLPESNSYGAFVIEDFAVDCLPGRFGIPEPSETCLARALNQLDLILVPGVGFDFAGRRLGRGKGFYDRLLAGVLGTKCGVAFDEQMVEALPFEGHDVSLNCILTPTRWIEVSGQRPV